MVVERHGEIQAVAKIVSLSMVSAALGLIVVSLEKLQDRDGHPPLAC